MKQRMKAALLAGTFAGLVGVTFPAKAHMVLTAAGVSDGFTLSTYYTDPGATYGVLSLANAPGGSLIASGYARGQSYTFPDTDGQSFGSQTNTAGVPPGTPTGNASAGGVVYVGVLGGSYYSVNPATLALTPVALSSGTLNARYGLWGNQTNGHLIAGTDQGLVDLNPLTGVWALVGNIGNRSDGVSVSPDGKTAYVEVDNNRILGYSLTSVNPNTPVFDSGLLGGGPDGTGVISGGLFDGDIVVNNNNGTLALINPTLPTSDPAFYTIIANGGSRGDLVSPDLSNGTLFLTQYEEVQRLSCGTDCSIGGPPPVPEPASFALLAPALIGLAAFRRRRA